MIRAYEEIVDFIAAGTSPLSVIDFKPSPKVKERFEDLLLREKTSGLDQDEADELSHYLQLEHLMRMAKAKARVHLAND